MSWLIGFALTNPLVRKVALLGLALGGLWYVNKLSINHAYDQGKVEGARAAWVEAEKTQLETWKVAQQEIAQQYKVVADARVAVENARLNFETQRLVTNKKKVEILTDATEQIVKAEEALAAAPVEDDGLPPKNALLENLRAYAYAYDATSQSLAWTEREYSEYVALANKEFSTNFLELKAVQDELAQVKTERDFYKDAFKQVTGKPKGRGFWHKVKRVVTLGIAR